MNCANNRLLVIFLISASFLSLGAKAPPDNRTEIVNLRYYTHAGFTRIVLDIGKLREYTSGELQQPGRIYLDVLQARLNPTLGGQAYPVKTDYLSQIVVFQKTPATVRVVVDVDFLKVKSYRAYHLFDPYRIVIDIYPRQASDTPETKAAPARPPDPLPSGYSMARQLGLGVRTIVLDPGHGGRDPGCIGKSGLEEKVITLDVATALKKMLVEKSGLNVILTRESDIMVPLETLPVIANQKRADLFVSIHVNAHRDRKREGVETFFLNFSPDPAVVELAARENATSSKNIGQMRDIILKIAQNSKIDESRNLAERIQKNLLQSLAVANPKIKDLGVRGAPFYVLVGSEMPSVLVEISHLSNAGEEARLKTARYRELAVQGIYNGIMEYVRSLGKG
ncbi:MAG: N-acetylmuramoyl-L-alanine amidase [Candidatus Aminicenantales bacterium]